MDPIAPALDLAGVGIGPFNLSVAALLAPVADVRSVFFESRSEFQWHPGLLLPESTLLVPFLKDLVTLADPTSRFSFSSYLFAKKRFHRFLAADFPAVPRAEFNEYFRWVASALPHLRFGRRVERIRFENEAFSLEVGDETIRTRNVLLGTGQAPYVPPFVAPHLGDGVFHASRFLECVPQLRGKRVAVIGGGQSGAEIVRHVLSARSELPRELLWITRRSNFLPLDASPFTNELFAPAYSDYFFGLPPEVKARRIGQEELASDGVAEPLLKAIYRRLYEIEFLEGHGRLARLWPSHELTGLSRGDPWRVELRRLDDGRAIAASVDVVILCTGFKYVTPDCLSGLSGRLRRSETGYVVRPDFSIEANLPPSCRVFIQNGSRGCRGVAEPNLSLMAWRSATIINSLAGRVVYDVEASSSAVDWSPRAQAGCRLSEFPGRVQ